jgi:hypothetical protein
MSSCGINLTRELALERDSKTMGVETYNSIQILQKIESVSRDTSPNSFRPMMSLACKHRYEGTNYNMHVLAHYHFKTPPFPTRHPEFLVSSTSTCSV